MKNSAITNGLLKSLSGCMIHCAQHGLTDEAQIIGAVIRLIQSGQKERLASILKTLADPAHTPEDKKEVFSNIHRIMSFQERQLKRMQKAQAQDEPNTKPAK